MVLVFVEGKMVLHVLFVKKYREKRETLNKKERKEEVGTPQTYIIRHITIYTAGLK